MKLLGALLLACVSRCFAIPLQPQQPLRSGAQLDWTNADCQSGSSGEDGTNSTVCIQQVFDPLADGDILGALRVDMFSGYMALSAAVNPVKLFFWVIMSEDNPETDPVVLWMNGGPGSTSLYGALEQWGPRLIDHTKRPRVVFRDNLNRVTEKMTWVFLEQPSGTGFSMGRPNIDESLTTAKDVSTFIRIFMSDTTKFNYNGKRISLAKRNFHIAGESFAGHWIPAIASYMVNIGQHNTIKFRSIMIGNGVTDAALITDAMNSLLCPVPPPLALPGALPATVAARCARMPGWKTNCDAAIRDCRADKTKCPIVLNSCIEGWGPNWASAFSRDVYDVTKTAASRADTRLFFKTQFAAFMNDPARKIRLGVTGAGVPVWQPGNQAMIDAFVDSGDWFKSYIPELQNIIKEKIDVLLYAGETDLMCPYTLVKSTATKINWNEDGGAKRDRFRQCAARPDSTYKTLAVPPNAAYGHYIRSGKLTYARVNGAGHMISDNMGREAKHLFETWVYSRQTLSEC